MIGKVMKWKEVVAAYFEELFQNFHEEAKKNHQSNYLGGRSLGGDLNRGTREYIQVVLQILCLDFPLRYE
jgi:hypothetical protein